MQFSLLALAAFIASAAAQNGTVVAHTTVTLTAYTYVCPEATTITHGTKTYTGSAHETLTLTEGPYTVVKPVYTSSVVICKECPATGTASAGFPIYTNGTSPSYHPPGAAQPTLEIVPTFAPHAPSSTPILEANSGNKVFAFSGASLAALVGVAAFIL